VSNRRLFFTRPLLDRASLTKALAAALSAARAYQSLDWELDRAEIQLLSSLAFRRLEEAVFPDLMAAFPVGMPPAEVKEVVNRLANLGLLLPLADGRFYLPASARQAFAPEGFDLRQWLELCTVEHLKAMARHMKCQAPAVIRKAELIRLIYEALRDGPSIRRIVTGLTLEARSILDLLVADSEPPSVKELQRRLPERLRAEAVIDYPWQGYDDAYGRKANAASLLQKVGLLYVHRSSYATGGVLVVPQEVRQALRVATVMASWYVQPQVQQVAVGAPYRAHSALLPDLVRALTFLEQERPAALKGGGFPKPALKKLAQRVTLPDPDYASFLTAMLFELGLAAFANGCFLPTDGDGAWLDQDRLEQLRSVAHAWRGSGRWNEWQVDSFLPSRYPGDAPALRGVLPSLCQSLPPDGVTVASLRELMEYVRPVVTNAIGQEGDWPSACGRMVKCLHWLGIAKLAAGAEPALAPGWGLPALLDRDGSAAVENGFVVQPNREIIAPPDINLAVLRQLLRLGEGAAVDGAIVLQLTVASIRRGLECGLSGEEMLAFLDQHATKGVPQTVRHFVQDIAAQYGQIEVGPAEAYVKVARPELLRELLATAPLQPLLRPITETVALIAQADQPKLIAALNRAGHLPRVIESVPRVVRQAEPGFKAAAATTFVTPDWHAIGKPPTLTQTNPGRQAPAGEMPAGVEVTPTRSPAGARVGVSSELLQALDRGAPIEIRYRNAKGALSTRIIEPLSMDFDASRVRAFCHCTGTEATFEVDNIVRWRFAEAVEA